MSERDLLARAGRVVDAVLAGEQPLRFAAVQALFGGLNPASCSRLLARLVEEGLLRREEDGYHIGPRLAQWSQAGGAGPGFAELARPRLEAIRDAHAATAIAIERQGRWAAAVAKAVHEDAPALMPVGRRFPPRLPYFGCVVFLEPPAQGLSRWVRDQMVDVDAAVAKRVAQGVTVTKRYLREGVYRDRELWPGQCRVAVSVRVGGETLGLIGAAIVRGPREAAAERALLADCRAAAERVAERWNGR